MYTPQDIPDVLLKEQLALEEEIRQATVQRYYDQHDHAIQTGNFGGTHAGRNILNSFVEDFLKGIEEYTESKANQPRRRPRAYLMLEQFGDNKAAAYLFLKYVLDTIVTLQSRHQYQYIAKRTTVLLAATEAMHDEMRIRYFRDNYRNLLRKIAKDHAERNLPRRRRRDLMQREFKKMEMDWRADGWGQRERIQLGLTLMEILVARTGFIVETTGHNAQGKTIISYSIHPEYVDQLTERMAKSADAFTLYYPTVIPPKPWKQGQLRGGGYYTDNIRPYPLIKRVPSKFLSELEHTDMTKVIEPVNAMQNTAWKVNGQMIELVDWAFHSDLDVPGIPPCNHLPMPEKPPRFKEPGNEEIDRDYKHRFFETVQANNRNVSKRLAVLKTIAMGRRFLKYDRIYYPHDLDSRGRAYPKVPYMNPQGPDWAKSMIEFSEAKPIETEEHAAYLAIAIANAWGQDKLPLQERVDWVEDNEEMLLEIARDPKGDVRWVQADEPFMALRGALEWAAFCEEGFGYMSRMPVHFDATCSGLQHFSALLRDAEGGHHVNLTDCQERQDIYGAVAKKAQASIEKMVNDPEVGTLARVALDIGINRKLCKRPVMIVPYAGTFKACMSYVGDYYRDEVHTPIPLDEATIDHKLIPFVAKHVWAAIGNTVIAARDAMDWITKASRVAVKQSPKAPIMWETPDGFIVRQATYDMKEVEVYTYLDGVGRVKTKLMQPEATLDTRKMAQSLSPNYIHSLDACHLRMSIIKGMEIGIGNFAMIHDSFGVHASEMPRFLNECIKPSFIEMYEGGDNLNQFREELTVGVTDWSEVPAVPRMGTLDIYEVQSSQFFFS